MSLLGTLFSKIFPPGHPAANAATTTAGSSTASPAAGSAAPAPTTSAAPAGSSASAQPVDVEAILNDMAKKNAHQLNWRTSIVDLMKLVGMDSSLDARKQLARELNYSGDTNDSATMNVWLHKQVMAKIAQNGGKVPAELAH